MAYTVTTAPPLPLQSLAADAVRTIGRLVGAVGRQVAVVLRGEDVVEIPDRLRGDAGLPPKEPDPKQDWWSHRWP